MKVGDLVSHNPSCFDDPWSGGVIIETREETWDHPIECPYNLTQHKVYWPSGGERWIEEGLLEVTHAGR